MDQAGIEELRARLPRHPRGYRRVAWAVLVLGVLFSGLGWWRAVERLQHESDAALDEVAAHTVGAIDERFGRYVDLLTGFQSLFHGGGHVSRRAFSEHFFSMNVHSRYPGVLAVQYSPLIEAPELLAFEADVRGDSSLRSGGYPRFHTFPRGDRDNYLPVTFNEPMAGNEAAFGADLLVGDGARLASERARDKGEPVLSAPATLLQGELGVTLRVPVYRGGMWPRDETQRRAAYVGQVTGVFRALNLMREVLPVSREGYRMRIADIGSIETGLDVGGGPALLFDSASMSAPFQPAEADVREHVLPLNGRLWSVQVARQPLDARWLPLPLALLGGGLVASMAAFAVLFGVATGYERAARLALDLGREVRRTALRLKTVIDSTADGIVTIDAQHTVTSVNPAFLRMLGSRKDEVLGRPLGDFVEEAGRLLKHLPNAAGGVQETLLRGHGGRSTVVDASFSEMSLEGERQWVAILRDASQRRRVEEQIRFLAHHDALTRLPNRTLLQDRLQHAFELARREGRVMGVLFVDLDHFKAINDSLGHDVGDALLCAVAGRLRDSVRASDTVARMGGDEFVVLLPSLASAADCAAVAAKMLGALSTPVDANGHRLSITPSIGGAVYPGGADSVAALMRNADAAMYEAKLQGRNGFRLYDGV
ncbi:diguanylate cyclase [Aquabacterium sp. A7-Y]|uniref:sensor domain-containing diguanylate cyclase n=1 Tax=Aquabacterium sp. A7-Y TaxID=1349605 RepID=UPI00223D940A|nr:diguanylate cyclase [Aquabacterium sp. A7-Y]MCW7541524.1 diguanylate cyclase [Aquabacterium sp. A7-Y]